MNLKEEKYTVSILGRNLEFVMRNAGKPEKYRHFSIQTGREGAGKDAEKSIERAERGDRKSWQMETGEVWKKNMHTQGKSSDKCHWRSV